VFLDFLGDLYTLPITGGEAYSNNKGLQFDSFNQDLNPNGEKSHLFSDASGVKAV